MFSLSCPPLSVHRQDEVQSLIWQLNEYELLKCDSAACVSRTGPVVVVVVWIVSLLRCLPNAAFK